jgi:hypothetical protein
MQMSTPLFTSSFSISPMSLSVPPSNVNTPFDMKFENTIP